MPSTRRSFSFLSFQPQTVLFLRMHACITWSYTYIHSNTQKGRKEGRKEGHSLTHTLSTDKTDRQDISIDASTIITVPFFLFVLFFESTHLSLSVLPYFGLGSYTFCPC